MQDLKEAVEIFKSWIESDYGEVSNRRKMDKATVDILHLAQLFLEVKGMPEKETIISEEDYLKGLDDVSAGTRRIAIQQNLGKIRLHNTRAKIFNETLDLCTLAHVKLMQENMLNDEKEIRQFIWLNHGCPQICLYGDDGEMQCSNGHLLDFKRMPIIDLIRQIEKQRFNEAIHQAAQHKASLKEGR